MKTSDLIGGGGLDPRDFNKVVLTTSQTYVAPYAGKYFVIVNGGGGAGGKNYDKSTTGGFGGEAAWEFIELTEGESVLVTIGAGGVGNTTDEVAPSGGDTTFGVYLTGRGGTGGITANNYLKPPAEVIGSSPSISSMFYNADNRYVVLPDLSGTPIHLSLFGLFSCSTRAGIPYITNLNDTNSAIVQCGGGGGPSLLANGPTGGQSGVLGAGGGGAYGTTAVHRAGATGGDGFVIIFEEIQ